MSKTEKITTLSKRLAKEIPLLKKVYKVFYRNIIKSKYIYLLSTSTKPLSKWYGLDRGLPIDRYYIEQFLLKNKTSIHGKCLELLNNNYTKKFGESAVITADVLDIDETNSAATIIGDLRNLSAVSDNTYDSIILTQVLQFIDDTDAAIAECYRILKPGGILLVTLPAISRIDCISGVEGDFWRFTTASAEYQFSKKFKTETLDIQPHGNARTGLYFYAGLAQEDVSDKIFQENDHDFPTLITVVAKK